MKKTLGIRHIALKIKNFEQCLKFYTDVFGMKIDWQPDNKNVYLTNVLPWKIPQNRTPTDEEILEFLPFLQRQIEIIKPDFMFLLGTTAAKAILSTPLSLDKLRGKWYDYKSFNMDKTVKVLVSYHPKFLLQSPEFKKEAWSDLQMLQNKINEN